MSATSLKFSDLSVSAFVAGLIATLTGYTSSLVLMIQAGQAAHLSSAQISSWLWALSIGMGVTTIGLSLAMRVPVVVAWSTPGAALLIASLPGVPYPEAIGAFLMAALLMTAAGLTGWFDKLMRALPASIASALLAGILFRISVDVFVQAQDQTMLMLAMFAAYLAGRRWWPRYAVPGVLLVGVALAGALGQLHFEGFRLAVAVPVWTTPAFSFQAFVSIAIPLFIVALASQNIPGLAVLRADGYHVPASPLITVTGFASAVLAPFGSHGINLAAITAAICTGPQATPIRRGAIPPPSSVASGIWWRASWPPALPRCSRHFRHHTSHSAVRQYLPERSASGSSVKSLSTCDSAPVPPWPGDGTCWRPPPATPRVSVP